jgi:hypothetical protein
MNMRNQSIKHLAALVVLLAALACPTTTRADLTVHSGWDLLWTQPGTQFLGDPYVGVPLLNYNFGGTIGSKYVGLTDTIVQRLPNATVPGPVPPSQSTTIGVQMDALQLASAAPINFGGGPLGTYYITLQSVRGGPASLGSMTISFDSQVGEPFTTPHGTFSSSWDIFFDVRYGALNGPIVYSADLPLSSSGTPWVHYSTDPTLLIEGVNHLLKNDGTINQDFFPGIIHETHPQPTPADHFVIPTIPEPTSGLLAVLGIALLGLNQYRRKLAQ